MVTLIISRLAMGTFAVLLMGFSLLIAWPIFAIVVGIIIATKAVENREPVTVEESHLEADRLLAEHREKQDGICEGSIGEAVSPRMANGWKTWNL